MEAPKAHNTKVAVREGVSGAIRAPVVKEGGQDGSQHETGELTEFQPRGYRRLGSPLPGRASTAAPSGARASMRRPIGPSSPPGLHCRSPSAARRPRPCRSSSWGSWSRYFSASRRAGIASSTSGAFAPMSWRCSSSDRFCVVRASGWITAGMRPLSRLSGIEPAYHLPGSGWPAVAQQLCLDLRDPGDGLYRQAADLPRPGPHAPGAVGARGDRAYSGPDHPAGGPRLPQCVGRRRNPDPYQAPGCRTHAPATAREGCIARAGKRGALSAAGRSGTSFQVQIPAKSAILAARRP